MPCTESERKRDKKWWMKQRNKKLNTKYCEYLKNMCAFLLSFQASCCNGRLSSNASGSRALRRNWRNPAGHNTVGGGWQKISHSLRQGSNWRRQFADRYVLFPLLIMALCCSPSGRIVNYGIQLHAFKSSPTNLGSTVFFSLSFAVVSDLWGPQCVRLKVTVKSDNCGENAQCSGKGICFSNASMVSVAHYIERIICGYSNNNILSTYRYHWRGSIDAISF